MFLLYLDRATVCVQGSNSLRQCCDLGCRPLCLRFGFGEMFLYLTHGSKPRRAGVLAYGFGEVPQDLGV